MRERKVADIKEAMVSPNQLSAKVSTMPKTRIPISNVDSEAEPQREKPVPEVAKAKEMALEAFDPASLGTPTSLTELERNCRMLSSSPSKLNSYLLHLNLSSLSLTCQHSTIESDFLMFLLRQVLSALSDQKQWCSDLLTCIGQIPKLSFVVKFLTKKEKVEVREIMEKLECGEELRRIFGGS